MDEKIFIDKLFESHKLINSPVAYLPELLQKFLGDEIDAKTFKHEYLSNTGQAKVYLCLMPQDLIEANQEIFFNEFIFADKINQDVIDVIDGKLSEREFRGNLQKHIEDYIETTDKSAE